MPTKHRVQTKNCVRTWKPKVRTACMTCRVRRIKCDEAKPNCQKCSSTGRKCDGYLTSPSISRNSISPVERLSSPESHLMKSDRERRSFDFFCKRTFWSLSGTFDTNSWTRLVLQATHHEPAVKHAVIALGAVHECFETGTRDEPSAFAMRQYGMAIRHLVESIPRKQTRAADVALMTMRGNHGVAISHVESGVKIISELESGTNSTERWSISTLPYARQSILNHIFIRLDRQVSELSPGKKRLLLDQILDDKSFGYHKDIPLIFTSLGHARNALDHIRASAMCFVSSAMSQPSFSDPVKRRLMLEVLRALTLTKLQQWSNAFRIFGQENSHFDVSGQDAIHVLRMHRIVAGLAMEVDEERSFVDKMVWDQYESQFAAIVSHASSIVDRQVHLCEKQELPRSAFYLDSGIIVPLFFVAATCRDGAIRRNSIALLKAIDRREGMWNSTLTARIAERVMSIEEEGLASGKELLRAKDVPNENRLGGVNVRWVSDRRMRLGYSRMGRRLIGADELEDKNVVVEEWLDW